MRRTLFIIACSLAAVQAWSGPFYPAQRAPMRFTRYAPFPPPQRPPVRVFSRSRPQETIPVQETDESKFERPKRDDDYNYDHIDHDHGGRDHGTRGVTGPVHTFVKTDKNANYKWGVRHHVGNKFAS